MARSLVVTPKQWSNVALWERFKEIHCYSLVTNDGLGQNSNGQKFRMTISQSDCYYDLRLLTNQSECDAGVKPKSILNSCWASLFTPDGWCRLMTFYSCILTCVVARDSVRVIIPSHRTNKWLKWFLNPIPQHVWSNGLNFPINNFSSYLQLVPANCLTRKNEEKHNHGSLSCHETSH